MKPRIYRLSEEKPRCRRVLSAAATPPLSGKQTSWVTITRTGSFTDPRYGPFEPIFPPNLRITGKTTRAVRFTARLYWVLD